ncbi:hypothetical protein L198_07151 [Cryptococcus wingfieldii CBS 7118]|uniref:Alpha/beta hydrolase fold-3 domain-containing protein n=1 Tax=Cryptococcus wingfieldii CBS 7118 TaxID=1295528 RepID=A0A1E3IF53_9TREE|nr:hypothetical protein L198_07151 [Cryptococcus wingfieldii CBS 7118]ODN87148.1 hypothetical protein L198_07151 [Cryptococcus wingfieldii CBS 7118]
MSASTISPETFVYAKRHNIKLDAYLPTSGIKDKSHLPVFVHFHGGGIVAGSRADIFLPAWITSTLPSKGFLVISADYRLLFPSSADDIITDVHTLFSYIASPSSDLSAVLSSQGFALDTTRIVVSGESGGNYPAKAAATLASVQPRPIAWVDRCGQGGDWLSDHWVKPYNVLPFTPFIIYDKAKALKIEREAAKGEEGQVVVKSAYRMVDGKIQDDLGRFNLCVYWLEQGLFVDRLLGLPGISAKLATVPHDERLSLIPTDERHILLPITRSTCPIFVVHGTADGMVPFSDSEAIAKEMEEQGLEVEKRWREGDSHGFFNPITFQPSAGVEELVDDILSWNGNKVGI